MKNYHYIMQIVWIIVATATLIASTWMGFSEGFDKWWMMYLFVVITLVQYIRHKMQYKKLAQMHQADKVSNKDEKLPK